MAAERDTVATRSGAELIPRQERWQSGKCIKSDGRRCCGVSLFFLSHLSMTYLMKRMKLVKLQSRLWNYMLLLVDVVFNTVKYREMRPRNLFPTFPVLYQRKVELHLFSGMLKSMSGNIKHDFLFAEKSIQTMYKG